MKKFILTAIAIATLAIGTVTASAKVGDIAGDIYTTDILTQVDGLDIQSYAINGQTLIALEDLAPYGFNVYYNDNIRTVFITKCGEPSPDFKPHFERGKVGEVAGHYYETDIKAVVNGESILGGYVYAIDGKMAAPVEVIGTSTLNMQERHEYQMLHSYNDSKRLLSLTTSLSLYGTPDGGRQTAIDWQLWSPSRTRILRAGNTICAEKWFGGLPPTHHGNYAVYYYVCLDNGLIYNAKNVIAMYDLYPSEPVLSEDGEKLYFKNNNYLGEFQDYKQLEVATMHIYPLDEVEYVNATKIFKENDYKLSYDGKIIPLYTIGSEDCIKLSDLRDLGCKDEIDNTITYNDDEYAPLSVLGVYYDNAQYYQHQILVYEYDVETKTVTVQFTK